MSDSKLSRKKENRERTIRNLLTSLVLYEAISTTKAKARAVIPLAERLLNRSMDGSLASRRYAKSILFDDLAVTKLFDDFPTRWSNRSYGFVKITNLPSRAGDNSAVARLELLLKPIEEVIKDEQKVMKLEKK